MATRAKALKKFAKNVLHHDLTGMSETAVLKDLLKQEFNIDAVGNSVVSVLMNAVSNDGGGMEEDGITIVTLGEGSYIIWVTDTETGDALVTQHYVYDGQEYDVAQALLYEAEFPAELVESVIFNGEEVPKDGLTFHLCHGGQCDCQIVPYDETQPEESFSVTAEIDGDVVCGCVIVPVRD